MSDEATARGLIRLTRTMEHAVEAWAADDRLWTTQETVASNLRTFARVILKHASEAGMGELGGFEMLPRLIGVLERLAVVAERAYPAPPDRSGLVPAGEEALRRPSNKDLVQWEQDAKLDATRLR